MSTANSAQSTHALSSPSSRLGSFDRSTVLRPLACSLTLGLFFLSHAFAAEAMTEAQAIAQIERLGGRVYDYAPRDRSRPPRVASRWRSNRGRPAQPTAELLDERFGDEQLRLLRYLPSLERVVLNPRTVSDVGIHELRQLPHLKSVGFRGGFGPPIDGMTDAGLQDLTGIKTLTDVEVPGRKVTERGAAHLPALKNLESLGLSGHGINNAAIAHLSSLTKLKVLSLADTTITDDGLKALEPLGALTHLTLHSEKLSDGALAHLRGLNQLTSLGINGGGIKGATLGDLTDLPKLRWLSLSYTSVDDAGLRQLSHLAQVIHIDLSHTRITDAGLRVLTALPNLEHLNIGSTAVTDAGLEALKPIKTLREVAASDAMTTEAIRKFSRETGVNFPGS